jgi:hypothetical protein
VNVKHAAGLASALQITEDLFAFAADAHDSGTGQAMFSRSELAAGHATGV